MPYTTDELIEPFWAAPIPEASGRDPLGIQNSSVVIYSKLISGITNVTNRVRYNGFYCWIIRTILENIKAKNSLSEQVRFIRRAELLLAYIMVHNHPDETGVSGSDYAAKNKSSKISLRNGADWDTKTEDSPRLYWKFKSGAFGQYFSGVLSELNLINHPQARVYIYSLTDKGNALAHVFGENIPIKERRLFWELTFQGNLKETDLNNLKSFSLININATSKENEFYQSLFLSEDNRNLIPTYNRRDSIRLLLKFLSGEKKEVENLPISFLRNNYKRHIKAIELDNSASTGWYLYEINELLHVAYEHFHGCFLYILEHYPQPVEEIIESLIKLTKGAFSEVGSNISRKTINGLLTEIRQEKTDVYLEYDEMLAQFRQEEWGYCLMNAIMVLSTVYCDCEKHFVYLKTFAWNNENNFNRPGYANELFEEIIEENINLPIVDFIRKILLLAINQHTFSSYRKSKIGQGLVHNYMIENNMVWRLRNTEPNRTSPRLQNVTQYLADLGWILKKGKTVIITETGRNIAEAI